MEVMCSESQSSVFAVIMAQLLLIIIINASTNPPIANCMYNYHVILRGPFAFHIGMVVHCVLNSGHSSRHVNVVTLDPHMLLPTKLA